MTDDIKKEFYENFNIDSLRGGYDYDEPLVWGYAVGIIIHKLKDHLFKNKIIVSQFHEWLSAPALLYLKKNNLDIATVFTTHATVLGRTLANNHVDLYHYLDDEKRALDSVNPDQEAYKFNVESKHFVEKAASIQADIFTTVSEITGFEAEKILGRKPDHLLLNGLDSSKFPTFEDSSLKHNSNRRSIREFLLYYFFPYYSFDIKNTLFFFLAGRYEFRDKGIDIFIHALDKLNVVLKKKRSKKTVVAFIFVPAHIRSIKRSLLSNKTLFNDIDKSLYSIRHSVVDNVLYNLISGNEISSKAIFPADFIFDTKRRILKFKQKGSPVLSTHDLYDENDIITNTLLSVGLDNLEDDRVKVVFYPIYLTGADGLLNLDYYQCMSGCHLGVFPSFYEPWGYTPLEAAALGTSSVTTDLAGFGRFVKSHTHNKDLPGIFVLNRMGKDDNAIIDDLSNFMLKFISFSKHDRVQNKIEAKRLSSLADWKLFINYYLDAHNSAVSKRFK